MKFPHGHPRWWLPGRATFTGCEAAGVGATWSESGWQHIGQASDIAVGIDGKHLCAATDHRVWRLQLIGFGSQAWWDDPANPEMTALYLERFLNFGLARDELQSGWPIIGIAQIGSDLVLCNRHHLVLAERVRASGNLSASSPPGSLITASS
jgi:hypothetical protein